MIRTFLPRQKNEFLKFSGVETVKNFKTSGATVIWANHSLLKKDFQFLEEWGEPQINQWLVENFSSVSERQFLLQGLRTTVIPTEQKVQMAFRQRYHGRGDVLEVVNPNTQERCGFIDRKGSGIHFKHLGHNVDLFDQFDGRVEDIRRAKKTNGLLYMGQALREIHMDTVERMLAEVSLSNAGDLPGTVGNYAILQLPFSIFHGRDEDQVPAAMVLRQANIGRVWLPEYALPSEAKINGATFFGDIVDAGSFLFYNKAKVPFFNEDWVRDPTQPAGKTGRPGYAILQNLVQEVLTSDDSQAVVDEHIARMGKNLEFRREILSKSQSMISVLEDLLIKIIEEPKKYAYFLRTFHYLKRRGQESLVNGDLLNAAIQRVLDLPDEIQTINGYAEPIAVRTLALPLLSLLSLEKSLSIVQMELANYKASTNLQILSEYAWLFPYQESGKILMDLVALNPQNFVQSLRTKLLEEDIRQDPNFLNIKKMARFALENSHTQKWALSYFIELIKEGSGQITAPELFE